MTNNETWRQQATWLLADPSRGDFAASRYTGPGDDVVMRARPSWATGWSNAKFLLSRNLKQPSQTHLTLSSWHISIAPPPPPTAYWLWTWLEKGMRSGCWKEVSPDCMDNSPQMKSAAPPTGPNKVSERVVPEAKTSPLRQEITAAHRHSLQFSVLCL